VRRELHRATAEDHEAILHLEESVVLVLAPWASVAFFLASSLG
jgi:hypothetical protein